MEGGEQEQQIRTSRGSFGAVSAGPATGRPVVLLHGFPDDLTTFAGLQAALAADGRRSFAVALRGYAPAPLQGPYDLQSLASDLIAVVETVTGHLGSADVVGHDYGGQVAYAALQRAPELFGAAVTLAAPHPNAVLRNARRQPRQLWMSRYIVGFQVPRLAEWRVRRAGFQLVDQLWSRWAAPGWTPPAEHLRHVKTTLAASMPAPVAMYRGGGFTLPRDRIRVPLHCVLGAQDGCLLPAMADGQDRMFDAPHTLTVLPGCGHFPHLEAPEATHAIVRQALA